MSGKTVVVVGANTGLGLATAQHFAELKAKRVILACRDDKKAQRAAQSKSPNDIEWNSGLTLGLQLSVMRQTMKESNAGVLTYPSLHP